MSAIAVRVVDFLLFSLLEASRRFRSVWESLIICLASALHKIPKKPMIS